MQPLKLVNRCGDLVQVSKAQESTGSRIRIFTARHRGRMVNSCMECQTGNRKCRGRTRGWGPKAEVGRVDNYWQTAGKQGNRQTEDRQKRSKSYVTFINKSIIKFECLL